MPMTEVVKSYVKNILPTRPDEDAILGVQSGDLRDTDMFPQVEDDQILG